MPMNEEQLKANFTAEEIASMEGEPSAESNADEIKEEKKEPDGSLETGEKVEAEKVETSESKTELEEEKEDDPQSYEGKAVPPERFSKFYGKWKTDQRERDEIKEKFELFKTNPESYYEKYPDEKPADKEPAPREPEPPVKVRSFREMLRARVNDPNLPEFHGKTLAEIMQEGPEGIAAAQDFYAEYVQDVSGKAAKAKAAEEARMERIKNADNAFRESLSQEMFKKSSATLEKSELAKIQGVEKQVLTWMKQNNKMAMDLDDAYVVMRKKDLLKKAREDGAREAIEHAKAPGSRSVSATVADGSRAVGTYDRLFDASPKDVERAIDKMTDVQFAAFRKNAPESFKEKFPAIPW